MICDHLSRAAMYEGVHKHLRDAFAFLKRDDLHTLALGRYDLVPDDAAFALVQEYTTKPAEQAKWESHLKYIDVQFLVSGTEGMGYTYLDSGTLTVTHPYDAAGDYALYTGRGDQVVMTPGLFVVLWPHDAHSPTVAVGDPVPVRKVVVKLRVE